MSVNDKVDTSEAYDVVIVGARVAGASTAYLLARAGLKVLVLERSRLGADTLSTHALMRGGVLQLERWGLLADVIGAGTPPIRHVHFDSDGDKLDLEIKPSYGIESLYAPRRTHLDPILARAATAAGAEIRYGTTVTGLVRDRDTRVTGVESRDRHGHRRTVAAELVIGADGVRSEVARQVGAPFEREGVGGLSVVYGHWKGVASDRYEWIHRLSGFAGVIPTNGDMACVFAAGQPSAVGRGGRRVYDGILSESAPDVRRRLSGRPADGLRLHRARPGFVRRSWGPGWALVGDAGYWKDPISSHGMTQALRDAELLASAVAPAIHHRELLIDAVADYQATRDRISRPLFDVVDTIARQQWQPGEITDLLRRQNAAMGAEVEEIVSWGVPLAA